MQHQQWAPSGPTTITSTEQARATQGPHRFQSVVTTTSDSDWPVTVLDNGGLLRGGNGGTGTCAPCVALTDSALSHFISCLVLKDKARPYERDTGQWP
ncbi:hypothetical protein MTO96_029190 [Rhipicephalus appendiculatus]